MTRTTLTVLMLLLLPLSATRCVNQQAKDSPVLPAYDLVIQKGRVMDPDSGLDAVRYLGITDGKVRSISEKPLSGKQVIDADGMVVAPGFIDLNTYEHSDPFFRLRAADGVTSVLHLEGGAVDVPAYYSALKGKALIHHGVGVDHPSARLLAAGVALDIVDGQALTGFASDLGRALDEAEMEKLAEILENGLRAGAVAVGFGIEYSPSANQEEVLYMVELAAKYDAPSHMHVRDFDELRTWSQLNEVFGAAIYTGGKIHINHLNSMFGRFSGQALTFIENANEYGLPITVESYPYTAGLTFIESAIFDDWESWPDDEYGRYELPSTGERLTRETFAEHRQKGGFVLMHARDEIAQENAIKTCMAHPLVMIASDGSWDQGVTHPRSAGTNSRVLGRYVREQGVLTLMEALRKMTIAPARHLETRVAAMKHKGRLSVDADADIVIFDPNTIMDNSTYREPLLPPTGIEVVIVNGTIILQNGHFKENVFPGRALRGPIKEN